VCLVAAALCLGAGAAHADPRYYGGARWSFTMADVASEVEQDPRFGVGGGVFVAGTAWNSLDLRLEANYVQKGARLTFSQASVEWQMEYIEVPLFLVWNTAPKSGTAVEFYGGVSYGFPIEMQYEQGDNLGFDMEDFEGIPVQLTSRTALVVNDVEDSDLSFALGIGLSVPVGQVNFLVDARYTRSLTDPVVEADLITVVGDGDTQTIETDSIDFSNRVFSFFVGFAFPFGARGPVESE
jgi:hypothetical protein